LCSAYRQDGDGRIGGKQVIALESIARFRQDDA